MFLQTQPIYPCPLRKKRKSIFNSFGAEENKTPLWIPTNTFNFGCNYSINFKDDKNLLLGLNSSYQGKSNVSRQLYFDNNQSDWIFETDTISLSSRNLLNLNIKYQTKKIELGFVVRNLLNEDNYLPAIASPMGQVMGETRVWFFTVKVFLSSKGK